MVAYLAVCLSALWVRALAAGPPHPNAIKGPGLSDGGPASVRPGAFPGQQAKNHASGETQAVECARDADCSRDMFCGGMRLGTNVCAACRRIGKRCHRHQMCCLGSHCSHGTCTAMTSESSEEEEVKSLEPSQLPPSVTVNIHLGVEGSACQRSSECAAGLCCARHLWSRVCKRVRARGEACSRRPRPERSRGLELFERCDCGPGLACRPDTPGAPHTGTQKDGHHAAAGHGRNRGGHDVEDRGDLHQSLLLARGGADAGHHEQQPLQAGAEAGASHPIRSLHVCQVV